jgi:iron complex outermembrane receptor protein
LQAIPLLALTFFLMSGVPVQAQQPDTTALPALKRLSLEQLLTVEVTSVSKRPEPLATAPSAIQVISGEDIRRSGATNLADALRLLSNLQVAQANSSQWAISARGFDNILADKLLVLIDGRTVYTPQYAGVYWDVQTPPLESIDRIEVISGPGGALWGANAVNGVINIVTKDASQTKGLYAQAGGGQGIPGFGELRYGGTLASALSYRAYVGGFQRGNTLLVNGGNPGDAWSMEQAGMRMDWSGGGGGADHLTLQSDVNNGRPHPDGEGYPEVVTDGGNVLGRWTRTGSGGSGFQLQGYYDHTYRNLENGVIERLTTFDLDWQHRFRLGQPQQLEWGLGARLMHDDDDNLPLFAFVPASRWLHLYSAFLEDEIALDRRLRLTVGSKVEHNDYTGFEVQPDARVAFTPAEGHTLWAAVSRAVRTPARLDRDFTLLLSPTFPFIVPDDFQSERLVAYEAGWRTATTSAFTTSLSLFYDVWSDIRSVAPGTGPGGTPLRFENAVRGHSEGVEVAATWQATPAWRLRGGYTYLERYLYVAPGQQDQNHASGESDDPPHQVVLQSEADLPGGLEWDAVLRYVDALPSPFVPSSVGVDTRLGWRIAPHLEVAVAGQNLLNQSRMEFLPTSPSPRRILRTLYATLTWR